MFDDFLNHKCNIYHLEEKTIDIGYGINATNVKSPGKTAVIREVPCHFHINTNTVKIVQKEPYSLVEGECKLTLPAGTDIRKNDTVEDCSNGLKYRAGIPKEIHGGHHIIVMLERMEGVKSAI